MPDSPMSRVMSDGKWIESVMAMLDTDDAVRQLQAEIARAVRRTDALRKLVRIARAMQVQREGVKRQQQPKEG